VALVVALSGGAWGDVIFDNGPLGTFIGWPSDIDPSFFTEGEFVAAEDFRLSPGANVIGAVEWWGSRFPLALSDVDDFSIVFFDEDPELWSKPGAVVASYSVGDLVGTPTGTWSLGSPVEAFRFELPSPLTLMPGTTYFVSIFNNTADQLDLWLWASSEGGQTPGFVMREPGGCWLPGQWGLDFRLTGPEECVVPEPATLSLMGIGIAGGAIARRLRTKK
jgi:hypothetical protein